MIRIAILLAALVAYVSCASSSTCEGQQANINCNANETLDIISAIWGRTQTTTCNNNNPSTSANTGCKSSNSQGIMEGLCQDRNNCSIIANNGNLGGDPCYGTTKYLNVTYDCVVTKTVESCWLGLAQLQCPSGRKIQIDTVQLRRESNYVCSILGWLSSSRCNNSDAARSTIVNLCQNKNLCFVTTSLLPLGSCSILAPPYLTVTYKCVLN